jgi:RNA polymerase sigma factor (sigma-70 family)
MDSELVEDIKKAKLGDQEAMLRIIKQYDRTILWYRNKHRGEAMYDDLAQDLRISLIKTVLQMSADLKQRVGQPLCASANAYIRTSLKHKYARILKIEQKRQFHEEKLDDDVEYAIERDFSDNSIIGNDLRGAISTLTLNQQRVIKLRYFHDLSDSEIGDMMHVSRQSVSQIRNRGLMKLRELLDTNTDQY